MTPDYRALCAELVDVMTDDLTGCWQRESDAIDPSHAIPLPAQHTLIT